MANFKDLTGLKFNRLLVLERAENKGKRVRYKCLCDCGNIIVTRGENLTRKRNGGTVTTSSCGCYWRERIKQHGGPSVKLSVYDVSFKIYFNRYKKSAENRNLKFNLSQEQFKTIIESDCFYCDAPPRLVNFNRGRKRHFRRYEMLANGIDRVDSSESYVIENSVSCCSICNMMKKSYLQHDFLEHIEKIHDCQLNKKKLKLISNE